PLRPRRPTPFPYTTLFRSLPQQLGVALVTAVEGDAAVDDLRGHLFDALADPVVNRLQDAGQQRLPAVAAEHRRNVVEIDLRNRLDRKSTRLNSSHQIISYA